MQTMTVTANGATVYTGTDEDAAQAAYVAGAKGMREDGDEVVWRVGERVHLAATKRTA